MLLRVVVGELMKNKDVIKSAWLVRWERLDPTTRDINEAEIAAILPGRISSKRIQELVRQLYISKICMIRDKINAMACPEIIPPIRFASSIDGKQWLYRFTCGDDDPYLDARIVKNLRALSDGDGKNRCVWDDLPRPNYNA